MKRIGLSRLGSLQMYFGAEAPPPMMKAEVWPVYEAPFIRRHPHKDVGDDAVPPREVKAGLFGMIPHWAGELSFGRRTYNARSETVAEKPSFRDARRNGQHCVVPVEYIYEPDWRSGVAVPTRIQRKDGLPMGIAGLWTSNRKATGDEVFSFTMLTVNADEQSKVMVLTWGRATRINRGDRLFATLSGLTGLLGAAIHTIAIRAFQTPRGHEGISVGALAAAP